MKTEKCTESINHELGELKIETQHHLSDFFKDILPRIGNDSSIPPYVKKRNDGRILVHPGDPHYPAIEMSQDGSLRYSQLENWSPEPPKGLEEITDPIMFVVEAKKILTRLEDYHNAHHEQSKA